MSITYSSVVNSFKLVLSIISVYKLKIKFQRRRVVYCSIVVAMRDG